MAINLGAFVAIAASAGNSDSHSKNICVWQQLKSHCSPIVSAADVLKGHLFGFVSFLFLFLDTSPIEQHKHGQDRDTEYKKQLQLTERARQLINW